MAAYLDILILALLRDQPRHGYEIKKRVEGIVGRSITMNNNVLYPALKRFEHEGAVTSKLVPQPDSPPRRVFRLTRDGHELLRSYLEDFPAEMAADQVEFVIRVAFLHLIPREARVDILAARRAFLEEEHGHLQTMLQMASQRPADHPYAASVVEFTSRAVGLELRWIEELEARIKKGGKK